MLDFQKIADDQSRFSQAVVEAEKMRLDLVAEGVAAAMTQKIIGDARRQARSEWRSSRRPHTASAAPAGDVPAREDSGASQEQLSY